MASRLTPAEQSALDMFLAEWGPQRTHHSTLESGLRDARVTMDHGKALWLATLGYLVVFELLGRSVARPKTRYPHRSQANQRFEAGIREFSGRRVSDQIRAALWSLRCGLAHEVALRSQQRHVFQMRQDGPLVLHPRRPWDGTLADAARQSGKTQVNVRAVGDLAEDVVSKVRDLHQAGRLVLAPGRSADDLRTFGGFTISYS